jgi:hypothetical protein
MKFRTAAARSAAVRASTPPCWRRFTERRNAYSAPRAAIASGRTPSPPALPVLVETPSFASDLVLMNPGSQPISADLTYVESLAHPNGSPAGNIVETLGPVGQRILPNGVDDLRSRGVVIGPGGLGNIRRPERRGVPRSWDGRRQLRRDDAGTMTGSFPCSIA